jgi:hypothetical protein
VTGSSTVDVIGLRKPSDTKAERYPNGHRLKLVGRRRIACHGVLALQPCGKRARYCGYRRWRAPTPGIAFDYYCAACWRTPGADGKTAEERAMAT